MESIVTTLLLFFEAIAAMKNSGVVDTVGDDVMLLSCYSPQQL